MLVLLLRHAAGRWAGCRWDEAHGSVGGADKEGPSLPLCPARGQTFQALSPLGLTALPRQVTDIVEFMRESRSVPLAVSCRPLYFRSI